MLAAEMQPAVCVAEHGGVPRHLAGPEVGPRAPGMGVGAPRMEADHLELASQEGSAAELRNLQFGTPVTVHRN